MNIGFGDRRVQTHLPTVDDLSFLSNADDTPMNLLNDFRSQGPLNTSQRLGIGNLFGAHPFIADQANIYSVKPLIMFDVARLKTDGALETQTKTGLGAGLQFTIVVAKFELGYVRSLNHLANESRGNFIARLVFQNLF